MTKILICPCCHYPIKKGHNWDKKETKLLQQELSKIRKRLENARYKHDYEDLTLYNLNVVNAKIRVFEVIEDFLLEELEVNNDYRRMD